MTDRTLAQVRTQFWIDLVRGLHSGKVPKHPVAEQLSTAVTNRQPSRKLLEQLASSRSQFSIDLPFDSLEQVEEYGESAFSSIYLLLLELMGNTSGHAKHAATRLGKCEGYVTLIRGSPYNASKRRVYIPGQLLSEQGLTAEQLLRSGGEGEGVRRVVELLAARAQQHLDSCRFRAKYLSREQKLVLLPAVAADHYLAKLAKAECNPWDQEVMKRNSWLAASLSYHKYKQTY